MDISLLQTKLYIPQARPADVVPRPYLLDRLNEGLSRKLSLISALAGSGKTTLVSDWLRRYEQPAAWLSLDEADNDLIRFWIYLIAALQSVQPHVGQTALAALQSPALGNLNSSPPLKNLLINLINDLAGLSEPMILVLDDYHLIETAEIHQTLNFLLDHLPPQLHLVLITREDPPLPLPRLRVRRQMNELRVKELHFTPAEVAQFFSQTMDIYLPTEAIAALAQRTEGWVAGLQMAALSMRPLDDPTDFIEAFTGDDRYIVDYLIAEVLDRQPAPIQQFLLQTAILERLTAPLCDAVTSQENGREVLTYLERANLFLIALDNRRGWYRYHHLFGHLLRYQLREVVSAAEIKQLHQRAAAWYAENGFTDEAIHHLLAAEDAGRAVELIEEIGLEWVGQGQLSRLLGWLEKLPDDLVRTRPLLCLYHAWALNLTGQTAALEARLQDTERVLANAPPTLLKDMQGQIITLRAYLARRQGHISLAIELLNQALADYAPDNAFTLNVINLNLGFNYWLTGQLTLADQVLQVARTQAQEATQTGYGLLTTMAIQADVYVAQGKLRQAAQLYEEAITYGLARNGARPFPPAGYAYAGLGGVLYEQNELEAAKEHLAQAIELGELLADGTIIRRGVFYLAPLMQIAGDSATAQALWQQAQTATDTVEERHVAVHQVRSWLVQAAWSPQAAELIQAVGWANAYRQSQPDPSNYQESFAQMTLAWVELAQGQTKQALARLEPLAAAAGGRSHSLIKILALQALAHTAQGETEVALAALNRALDLAAPEGYIRTFVDHGRPMQQLLQQATTPAIAPDYVSRLLAAFPNLPHLSRREEQVLVTDDLQQDSQIVNPNSEFAHLLEPLTDQELAILRLLAAGLSNQEIADQLYLSLNTIKWYVRHIFNKLAVNKRTQAVARARELGLL